MSLEGDGTLSDPSRFPRVSGDEPDPKETVTVTAPFSPRERG